MLRSRPVVITFLTAILLPSLVLAQDAGRLTSASNVRLRSEPVDTAAVVVAVSLGTPLVGIEAGGADRTWLRVRTAEGKEGWVLTRLTRRFTAETRLDVVEQIITERVGRKGDSSAARAELIDLLDDTMAETADAERAGRLALLWIRAMKAANRPLSLEALQDLHQRHRASSSADEIAWASVEHGLGGECEGYLPCYVDLTNQLQGEYLRRHPNGRHVDDAVTAIAKAATVWQTSLDKRDAFTADKDCGELTKSLTPLRAAVVSTRSTDRESTLEKLDRVGSRCGGPVDEQVTATPQTGAASTPPASPAAARPIAAGSRSVTLSVFAIAAAGLLGVAAMVILRRRNPPPSNRIMLS